MSILRDFQKPNSWACPFSPASLLKDKILIGELKKRGYLVYKGSQMMYDEFQKLEKIVQAWRKNNGSR